MINQKKISYSEAWLLIGDLAITDDPDVFEKDPSHYFVNDVKDVVEALVKDGTGGDDECLTEFLDRHGIEWK